jgi:two-component system NtrC family response regulator
MHKEKSKPKAMDKILVIEDNPDIQSQMKWGLYKDFMVLQASERKDALHMFEKKPPRVVTLDLGLPPDKDGTSEGFACLKAILDKEPDTKIIVITGNNDRENALKAVQMGAYDYYPKPVDINEIKVIIHRALHLSQIESENRELHTLLAKDIGFAGMIGQSPEMQKVFDSIKRVAATDVTVLLTGESGTGKELVARAIHERGPRSKFLFIPINCGAIPENLLESELFGYEKGAFTGAYNMKKGKVEFADGGTFLLDEVSELSPSLQIKLLRFLQEKKIQRVGGHTDIEVDVRIIAATNIDLQEAIKEGRFREDLFYRLSVITINLPPLRERGQDIMLLANIFLERYKAAVRKKVRGFSPDAVNAIKSYSWPGNVRELENKLQRAVIMSDSKFIEPHALGLAEAPVTQVDKKYEDITLKEITLKEAREKLEIELVKMNINKYKGNIKRVAKELGISRPTLYDLITKYGLNTKYTIK